MVKTEKGIKISTIRIQFLICPHKIHNHIINQFLLAIFQNIDEKLELLDKIRLEVSYLFSQEE